MRTIFHHPRLPFFSGIVKMYECYIGGKPRKGNTREDDKSSKHGRGTDKAPVIDAVERKENGKVPPEWENLENLRRERHSTP